MRRATPRPRPDQERVQPAVLRYARDPSTPPARRPRRPCRSSWASSRRSIARAYSTRSSATSARHGNGTTAGDVGYRYVLRALADGGRSDVIFDMNHQSERPGYGYQLARGATSLTEAWDANPRSSQNHFMLGQIIEWFYGDLAGLAPDPEFPGFERVRIRPQPVAGIDWARAAHASPRGRVAVQWRRDKGVFHLDVDLPPNTSAEVWMPAADSGSVREGSGPAGNAPGGCGSCGRRAIAPCSSSIPDATHSRRLSRSTDDPKGLPHVGPRRAGSRSTSAATIRSGASWRTRSSATACAATRSSSTPPRATCSATPRSTARSAGGPSPTPRSAGAGGGTCGSSCRRTPTTARSRRDLREVFHIESPATVTPQST